MNGFSFTKVLFGGLTGLLMTFSGCLTTGCTVHMHGNGEVGFAQSTRWGFYHSTELDETGAPNASATLEVQALIDWLNKERGGPDGE